MVQLYPKLEDFRELPAGNLSGGQREILLIGRALVGNPKVLLIDEPTEGLAAIVIEDIFRILSGMRNTVSCIIVEQNLSIVTRLADRNRYTELSNLVIQNCQSPPEIGQLERMTGSFGRLANW